MKLYAGLNLSDWNRHWQFTSIEASEDWEEYRKYCRNSAIFRVYTAGRQLKNLLLRFDESARRNGIGVEW